MEWPGYMIQVGGNAVAWVHDTGGGQGAMQWPGYMIQVGGNGVAWVHDTGGGQCSGLGT